MNWRWNLNFEMLRIGRLPCCEVMVESTRHSIHCEAGNGHTGALRRQNIRLALELNPNLHLRMGGK